MDFKAFECFCIFSKIENRIDSVKRFHSDLGHFFYVYVSVVWCVEIILFYNWYHFLSLYFSIRLWAVPPNSCAWLAMRSARSSNWLSFSPRSIANMCARLISDAAVLARPLRSCRFGPGMCLATDRFGLPLESPTGENENICTWNQWMEN